MIPIQWPFNYQLNLKSSETNIFTRPYFHPEEWELLETDELELQ
jgi:hypothetical protein